MAERLAVCFGYCLHHGVGTAIQSVLLGLENICEWLYEETMLCELYICIYPLLPR
jgi:hypothetical protein